MLAFKANLFLSFPSRKGHTMHIKEIVLLYVKFQMWVNFIINRIWILNQRTYIRCKVKQLTYNDEIVEKNNAFLFKAEWTVWPLSNKFVSKHKQLLNCCVFIWSLGKDHLNIHITFKQVRVLVRVFRGMDYILQNNITFVVIKYYKLNRKE